MGDACVDDYDGDGVTDVDDACPRVKHISKTSFLDYFTVDLYPGHSDPKPEWRVAKMVKRVKSKRASEKKNIRTFYAFFYFFNRRYGDFGVHNFQSLIFGTSRSHCLLPLL